MFSTVKDRLFKYLNLCIIMQDNQKCIYVSLIARILQLFNHIIQRTNLIKY